ncbi:MAG TPA: coenzyme F420-0:L-glutamate ligase, partial [Burkholderiales bacterium]|nr:coenzyme F420-0:L-glutamate ligase [Burkholderiales bacterium]
MARRELTLTALPGIPEIAPGANLGAVLAEAVERAGCTFEAGDVLVVAQKVVSKAEGRLVCFETVQPSDAARRLALRTG